MGKRLLASFLAVAMMLTMAPFAFAIENTEDTIDADQIPATEEAVAGENQIETQSESALQQAINSAADGSTVTMSESENADITINKNITLDLNKKILTNTNAGKATITVTDGATVTVKNGTVVGGTSYYNIQVGRAVNSTANLTLEGVTATAGNTDSSMIDNWGTLTINSGTYTGGLNVVKSEETSTLTINGGEFTLNHAVAWSYTGVILIYGTATINGGTFNQNATTPASAYPCTIVTGVVEGYDSKTTITNGTFINNHSNSRATALYALGKATSENYAVQGGQFSKSVSNSYLPNGYASGKEADGYYHIGTAITSITLDRTELHLKGGETYQLKVTSKEPADAQYQTVTWGTKTGNAAKVDKTGLVTAQRAGTRVITATPAGKDAKPVECTVYVEDGDAAIGSTQYPTLEKAIEAAKNGQTVKLLNDVDLDKTIAVSGKTITLDMNGHTIYNTNDLWDKPMETDQNWSLISVRENSNLTITGNGTLKAKKDDCYAIDVQDKNAVLTVENGKVVGNIHAVYVTEGTAYIKGGTYSIQQKYPIEEKANEFVLNLYDASGRDGTAKIVVTGGTFEKFNPANCQAEGEGTNFCAPGYKTELTNGVYVVKAGTNDAINAIDEAIKAIDGSTSDVNTKVNKAIAEVGSIPNETLSSNSSTMDKLAKLDEQVKKDPAKVEVKTDDEGAGITLSEVKNAALSASTTETAKQTITINVDPVTGNTDSIVAAAKQKVTGAGENAKALDITMTKTVENGEPTKIDKPTAPVVLTFTLPTGWKNAQIVYVDGDKTELVKTTVSNGKVSGVFNHFSTYVLVQTEASKNPNEYEIILTPNTTDVSAGDTLTYTVSLKHTVGDGTEGMFTFVPDTTSGLLSGGKFTAASGVTATYGPDSVNHKMQLEIDNLNLAKDNELVIGTLEYTVQAYGQDTKIKYTGSSEAVVSNKGREEAAGITLINSDVNYHVIKVTFQPHEGTVTEGYAAYGDKTGTLYATLPDLAARNGNKVSAPALDTNSTGGTKYRVKDTKWHLRTADGAEYPLTEEGIKTSATFVENWVELVKVDIPKSKNTAKKPLVEITEQVTRTDSDGNSYVDKGANLKFKLTEDATPNPGMEYEVKVKVGGSNPLAPTGPDENGIYTVVDTQITGDVEFVLTQKMNLTADDIHIFTDTDSSTKKATYRPFSTYSGNRTLVLIKGAVDAKYQFNTTDAPTIYATDVYTRENDYDNDYTLAVLIDSTAVTQVNKQAMLDYMINTLKLNTVTGDTEVNPTIVYDYATNGNTASKPLVHAQVARDFTQMLKGKENGWYWEPGDELLLKADVITVGDGTNGTENTYTGKPDGHVSEDDVATFMYLHVGKVLTTKP